MNPRERDEKDELLPDRNATVLDRLGHDVGTRERLADGFDPGGQARQRTEHLAKDDAAVRAGLLDDTWPGERRRDVGHTAKHARFAKARRQLARAVDAVLQRQDGRVRSNHRRDERQRRHVVIGLDGDNDDVDGADAGRVLFRPGRHREVPQHGAADFEPAGAHGRQMRTAGDERDVMPSADELGAVIAADGA